MTRKYRKLNISVSQKENYREYRRQYRKLTPGYNKPRSPEKRRETHWKCRYGITPEIYEEMLLSQAGSCAICSSKEPGRGSNYFLVDHNHDTNEIRGLLCFKCNTGLGNFKDSKELLINAANYLDTKKAPEEGAE